MDEKYLDFLQTFYDEKVKFLSGTDKFNSCKDCDEIKLFKESNDKLIFSCGGKDKCGTQFTINLAEYLHYEKELKKFKKDLENGININMIKQYIDVDDDDDNHDKIKKAITNLEEIFYENNIQHKEKQIQDFYDNRIRKSRISKDLLKKLKDTNLSFDQQKTIRQEYINLMTEMKNEYIEIKTLIHDINPFLNTGTKGTVIIEELTFEGKVPKKKKKEKGKEKKKKEGVEIKEIRYFSRSKKWKWLSTFNLANPFKYGGFTYPTVEHAFHAQKVNDDDSNEYKKLFTDDIDAKDAKKFGDKKYFEENNFELRSDWNEKRVEIMKDITKEYYKANPEMVEKLIETDTAELIHRGPRIDGFWGVDKNDNKNHHGKILMELREKFKNQEISEEQEQQSEEEQSEEQQSEEEEQSEEEQS